MLKIKGHSADYVLLAYFATLLFFGLLMLTSASAPLGYDKFGDKYFFIKRQILIGVLPGILAFLILSKVHYLNLKRYALSVFVFVLVLSLLVFIPGVGSSLGTGAKSWIVIGGNSMQPAEFLKLGMIIFLASYLHDKIKGIKSFKNGFLPVLGFGLLPVAIVVLQPDVGTASILFAILFGMLFVAGANIGHMVVLFGAGVAGFVAMIMVAPYRAARLMTFLHPELDPLGKGYHINQAVLAIGSGGFFGLGLGHSLRKYEFLPEVNADSIFAVIAEEMGFIFSAGLIVLLLLICYRGFVIARRAPDTFSKLLVSGIIIWFMVQSFMNIGAMVGLMPLTGVPMPFVSHGGTALFVTMASVGILINISKYTEN
jgi:cell division protein FtsW